VYSRDVRTEEGIVNGGVGGNLSSTSHDYLGVFTQNVNGSKADYWQRRRVSSHVQLYPDGTARERAVIRVGNPAPPYKLPTTDPRAGYVTRWLGFSVATFLPRETTVKSFSVDGRELAHPNVVTPTVPTVYNRPYLLHTMMLAPDKTARLVARYRAQGVADVAADGDLLYHLDMDPQGLVNAQTNRVTLRIPDGYHFGTLPVGWSQTSSSEAVLGPMALTRSMTWSVPVLKN
jgi:hypothetical protein